MKIGEYVWYRNAYGELQGPYELLKIDEEGWAYLFSERNGVKHVHNEKLWRPAMKEYKVKDEWNGLPVVATVASGDKIGDPDVAVKVLADYVSEVEVYAADDPDNDITDYFTEQALDEIAEKILGGE